MIELKQAFMKIFTQQNLLSLKKKKQEKNMKQVFSSFFFLI